MSVVESSPSVRSGRTTLTEGRVAGAYRTSTDVPPEVRHTILGDAREIIEELRHSGDLIKQLTLRDIRIRYKQAVFGFAWAILIPAAVVLAGMAVRVAVAYAAGRHIDMTQLAGMAVKAVPWAFFVGCLSTGTSSLVSNTSLVTKIYFPREVLPLSTVLAQTFDSLIGGTLIACVLPFFGVRLSVQLLWVPVLLALLWIVRARRRALPQPRQPVLPRREVHGPGIPHLRHLRHPRDPRRADVRRARCALHDAQSHRADPRGAAPRRREPSRSARPRLAPAGWLFWQPWYLAYSAAWAFGGLVVSTLRFHRSERHFAEAV